MANRRRKAGVRSGASKAGALWLVMAGRGARASSATPTASASANTMLATDKPATAGNTLGSAANWLLGRFAERFHGRPWFPVGPASLTKATRWYGKWGKWSLLFSWAPIIGDGLTLAAGLLRVPFPMFFALVLIAKGGRYLILAAAVGAFSR